MYAMPQGLEKWKNEQVIPMDKTFGNVPYPIIVYMCRLWRRLQ
jgi:hypothetical protein